MTRVRVGVVDVCVLRRVGRSWKVLLLRRGVAARTAGSWELVHGRIERGERPASAARRELREETGLAADRLYSITVNPFYLMAADTVQLAVVFAAVVRAERVAIGVEHDRHAWVGLRAACGRLTWPRDVETVRHAVRLLGARHRGTVEDTLQAD